MFHVEHLKADDVCKIIQSCKKYKVSRFQGLGFTIEFSSEPQIIEKEVIRDLHVEKPELSLKDKVSQQKERYDELLGELRLADPRTYERLVEIEPPNDEDEEIDG